MSSIIKPPPSTLINPLHPLSQGLVGQWMFNEGAGSLANDISGKGNHGSLKNMAPNAQGSGWGGSKFGGGLKFDGVDDYVDVGSDTSLNFISSDFTIDLWVKVNSHSENKIYSFVGNGAYKEYGYYVYVDNVGRIWLRLNQNLTVTSVYTASGVITLGEWQHLVIVRNGTIGTIYIDGINRTSVTDSLSDPLTSSKSVRIGYYERSSHFLNCSIDSVRIYNRALSADEVKTLYLDPFCNLMIRRPSGLYVPAAPSGLSIPVAMHHYNQLARA